jgi:hypothetical protein
MGEAFQGIWTKWSGAIAIGEWTCSVDPWLEISSAPNEQLNSMNQLDHLRRPDRSEENTLKCELQVGVLVHDHGCTELDGDTPRDAACACDSPLFPPSSRRA